MSLGPPDHMTDRHVEPFPSGMMVSQSALQGDELRVNIDFESGGPFRTEPQGYLASSFGWELVSMLGDFGRACLRL